MMVDQLGTYLAVGCSLVSLIGTLCSIVWMIATMKAKQSEFEQWRQEYTREIDERLAKGEEKFAEQAKLINDIRVQLATFNGDIRVLAEKVERLLDRSDKQRAA
jgi:uncharacterized coiled-coil protein SlyX